jgi:hypothetical protein
MAKMKNVICRHPAAPGKAQAFANKYSIHRICDGIELDRNNGPEKSSFLMFDVTPIDTICLSKFEIFPILLVSKNGETLAPKVPSPNQDSKRGCTNAAKLEMH